MGTFVSTEHDGHVAVVTIDNPPMNALSAALLEELETEIDRLDADDATRAVVLRGGGERAFVAGADIKEFPALRESAAQEGGSARGIQRLGARMDAAGTPFVAAITWLSLGERSVQVWLYLLSMGERIVQVWLYLFVILHLPVARSDLYKCLTIIE